MENRQLYQPLICTCPNLDCAMHTTFGQSLASKQGFFSKVNLEGVPEDILLKDLRKANGKPDNHWCIVCYLGATPLYYMGYFKRCPQSPEVSYYKPAISISFDDAMKLHSKEEAERIMKELSCQDWKVEEHSYA